MSKLDDPNINNENIEADYDTSRDEKLSELEILRQSVEENKKKAEDYYDQLLRLKAEFENYRNRMEKEKQTHRLWGKEEILLKQIDLLDVIEQAYESMNSNASPESIKKGLELIKIEFSKMLSSEGIKEIESLGQKFDPNFHEAIEQLETKEEEEGKILGVMQKGYMFGGRMIRPARVKVAKNQTADHRPQI
ncbi:MAG: nucleotide exchange factor GrpE [Elusimicrobia bacterium]|nr:nucleotide exchange factor GrpE [Candidatus Liberimonas magnetica]